MKIHFAKSDYPQPVSRRLLLVRFGVAAVFIVLVVAQLFAFEKMGTLIEGLAPGLSHGFAKVAATILVVLEAAALPSLLVVPLSPLARACSRLAGPLAMIGWYGLVYIGITTAQIPNSGLLGSKLTIPANLTTLLVVMAIFVVSCATQYIDVRSQSSSK